MSTQRKHLRDIIRERNGLTQEEAEKEFKRHQRDLIERIESGEMPFDYCMEEFGLEPDYLEDLI